MTKLNQTLKGHYVALYLKYQEGNYTGSEIFIFP